MKTEPSFDPNHLSFAFDEELHQLSDLLEETQAKLRELSELTDEWAERLENLEALRAEIFGKA